MIAEPLVVQAIFSFKGTNNDELCFKKGDQITVTQKEDGGWWEGTFGGKTGWFPSNYVKECKDIATTPSLTTSAQQKQYREVVLKDIVDSETAHVTELQGLLTNFLVPLEKSAILSSDEFQQLIGNLYEVVDTHKQLLHVLEEEVKLNHDARMGHIFLTRAPKIKAVHQTYCSLHPRAVCILDKYRDELTKFMESCSAAAPGILVLTTGLSKPFRRLDKYSGMLQELERHVEESHPDRGDTQRSVIVYKEIAATCAATRRQKELELQVLTGPVRGWEGQSLSALGDIIYMGSVAIGPQHHDRYLVLFPNTLLVLSVSKRLSAFIYEGKLPLTGIIVNRLEDSEQFKNAFEISGPMIEKRTAVCQSRDEANHWVELLRKHMPSRSNSMHQKPQPAHVEIVPQSHLNRRGYSTRTSVLAYAPKINFTPTYPPDDYPSAAPYARLTELIYKLIKKKIINKSLVKRLLYPEYFDRVYSDVKRRIHRTEFVIRSDSRKRDNIIKCSSDSDTESDSDDSSSSGEEGPNKIYRQNAVDNDSSDDSSSDSKTFGYIRYYNPSTGNEEGRYESMIDYGEVSPTKSKPSIILTSTANLQLLTKQYSESSDASSAFLSKPFTACQDLVNLDSSLEMETQESYVPTTRQSCPTKMIGNKFSKTSLTTIYIPTWQSSSDNNLNVPSSYKSNKVSESSTTHSSSIDIPVNFAPLPISCDKDESVESDRTVISAQTVIRPPSMFQNNDRPLSNTESGIPQKLTINPVNTKFRAHSINSDKPRRRSSIHLGRLDSRDLLRRCVSYKYLEMAKRGSNTSYCNCCQSPRSSDSGMAGSCTLNSPDIAPNDLYNNREHRSDDMSTLFEKYSHLNRFSDIEARTYESECQCTSPFGSTPRTSCQPSMSENIYSDSRNSTSWETANRIHSKEVDVRDDATVKRKLFKQQPQKSKSLTNINLSTSDGSKLSVAETGRENVEDEGDRKIYRSGLYAHWWMKAKIPADVVKGIYEETRSSVPTTGKAVASDTGGQNVDKQSPRRLNM